MAAVGVTGNDLNALTRIVAALARTFIDLDMTLAEINPIGRLDDGSIIALDAHMDMEAEARRARPTPTAERSAPGHTPRGIRLPTSPSSPSLMSVSVRSAVP